MSIHQHPTKVPLAPPAPHVWGELASEHQTAGAVRFVLSDRVVSFPIGELKRWEHIAGNPERLVITAGQEIVTVEGQELSIVRSALDESRLIELRQHERKPATRNGPMVRRIMIESR
ncbi:hypothetical protein OH491_01165 [Termitidicoccus mucosus]|uniref:Uncharacterized protein n=1 Tax=Termitidicoccus mucosus TaxID=1184151 RepID=A0A178IDA6_9BACT|nr:hypothetical protein AW736_24205 [Opitutaceae bacterium TSB47]